MCVWVGGLHWVGFPSSLSHPKISKPLNTLIHSSAAKNHNKYEISQFYVLRSTTSTIECFFPSQLLFCHILVPLLPKTIGRFHRGVLLAFNVAESVVCRSVPSHYYQPFYRLQTPARHILTNKWGRVSPLLIAPSSTAPTPRNLPRVRYRP